MEGKCCKCGTEEDVIAICWGCFTKTQPASFFLQSMQDKEPSHYVSHARHAIGATQQQMADSLGISRGTVSRWEKKKSKLSPMAKLSIRQLLEITKDTEDGNSGI